MVDLRPTAGGTPVSVQDTLFPGDGHGPHLSGDHDPNPADDRDLAGGAPVSEQGTPFPGSEPSPSLPDAPFPEDDTRVEAGTVVLFADGLRFDVLQRLVARLRAKGHAVAVSIRWAALPTVTATAKPAVSPVAERISECWSRLRAGSRVHYGGALSGRAAEGAAGMSAPMAHVTMRRTPRRPVANVGSMMAMILKKRERCPTGSADRSRPCMRRDAMKWKWTDEAQISRKSV